MLTHLHADDCPSVNEFGHRRGEWLGSARDTEVVGQTPLRDNPPRGDSAQYPPTQSVCLVDRSKLLRRVEPLGQVVDPCKTLALAHRQLSTGEERLEDPLGRRPLPPPRCARATKIAGRQRPLRLDPTQYLLRNLRMLLKDRAPPTMLLFAEHAASKVGQVVRVDQAGLVCPHLRDAATPAQTVERRRRHSADACRER